MRINRSQVDLEQLKGLQSSQVGRSLRARGGLARAECVPSEPAGEPILTLEEVSRQLNVSTKTVSRWRRHGLASSRVVLDGRPRVGFSKSSVDQFVRLNERRVRRAAQFSQVTSRERDEILGHARALADGGATPAEIVRRLSNRTGRSPETIRYLVKRFAQRHPELGLFGEAGGVLGERMKREIYERHVRGDSAETLAKTFGCSRTSVYRVIGEMRFRKVAELPLEYIPSEEFGRIHSERQEQEVLAPTPPSELPVRKMRRPADLPPYLASLYETPLLTRRQEVHLFRKMNYLKYKAARLRADLDPQRPNAALMDRVEDLYRQSVAAKNEIIRANLRLVVSIAKRRLRNAGDFFDLVSDGNMSLIRAVEKFDYGRGFKFSTYATWAIVKNFARTIPNELRRQERFRTASDEVFMTAADDRPNPFAEQAAQANRETQLARILDCLDTREQQVISHRFGLGPDQQPLTLREVGDLLGVTKERVRQLETRAITKLRQAAREEKLDLFGLN